MSTEQIPPSVPVDTAWDPSTVAVQAGRPARTPGAAMNPSMHMSATYVHDAELSYGRHGNAGWSALETALGTLDGGTAVTFSSGLAAATAIAELVPTGGVVVVPSVAYFGVRNIFRRFVEHGRLQVRPVDADDTAAVIAAADGAAMVWMESIANPGMVVADIPVIAQAAHAHGAIVVVDATFATPLRQRPIALGADVVMHSATKFIGGHSDLLLGAAVCSNPAQATLLTDYRYEHGAIPGNLEAFLALRGLRTLAVRLDRAEASATELARRLNSHPGVSHVYYGGLPGDSQHERAQRVLPDGCGAMLSFDVAGTVEQTNQFLADLRLITHATSLGGVETLIERRARYAGDATIASATLCRLSVGIEHVDDLWADIDHALRAALSLPA